MSDVTTANETVQRPAIGLKVARSDNPQNAPIRFGGHPNLPETVPWPKDSAGRPMHLLLQVDCASLPSIDPDFPEHGTLFIFVTGSYDEHDAPGLAEGEGVAFAVLYNDNAVNDAALREHPKEVPALGDYSLAMRDVRIPLPPLEATGLLKRLFNRQPAPYHNNETGFFAPVALDPVTFNSHPSTDPVEVLTCLDVETTRETVEQGIRPLQMLGYAPQPKHLSACDLAGYMTGTPEIVQTAYELAENDDAVLLFQAETNNALNLDLVAPNSAMQFWITRNDLKARKFDKCWALNDKFQCEGAWFSPEEKPALYQPTAHELIPTVALKPLAPGETPASTTNHFCGLPQLPDDLDWPRNKHGTPIDFLMQLDCASVPRTINLAGGPIDLPPLPETGTLFLFNYDHWDEHVDGDTQLLYTTLDVRNLPYREPPQALTEPVVDEFGYRERRHNKGMSELSDIPKADRQRPIQPRLPFDPQAFATIDGPDSHDDPHYDEKYAYQADAVCRCLPGEVDAYPGFTFVIDWMPNFFEKFCCERARGRSKIGSRSSPIRKIPQSYPWRWVDIEDTIGAFMGGKHVCDDILDQLWPDGIMSGIREWYAKAVQHAPLDRIRSDERAAYRAWLMSLDAAATKIPEERSDETNKERHNRVDLEHAFFDTLVRLGSPYQYASHGHIPSPLRELMHDSSADDFPDEIREAVGELIRFERSNTQLKGYNVVHEPRPHFLFAPRVGDDAQGDKIKLFRFTSGYGLSRVWGDCNWFQIWISPDDLSAKRFDKITVGYE